MLFLDSDPFGYFLVIIEKLLSVIFFLLFYKALATKNQTEMIKWSFWSIILLLMAIENEVSELLEQLKIL